MSNIERQVKAACLAYIGDDPAPGLEPLMEPMRAALVAADEAAWFPAAGGIHGQMYLGWFPQVDGSGKQVECLKLANGTYGSVLHKYGMQPQFIRALPFPPPAQPAP